MSKIETVCPYFKKQIVVERNHFGVGEHGHSLQDTEGRALLCAEDRGRAERSTSMQVSRKA